MVEYIDKQNLLRWLEEEWLDRWAIFDVQRQQDWRKFYHMVEDFPSVAPGEPEEDVYTYAQICIDSYFDPEQFYDLVVEGTAQCCICDYPFPVRHNMVKINKDSNIKKWVPDDKIFELENQVKEDLKKKVILWNFCPRCGRKIKGYH